MKKYKIYTPLLKSYFSKDLYRDVAKNWGGIGALYLLLLVSIMTIIITFGVSQRYQKYFKPELVNIINQLPEVNIKDGKLTAQNVRKLTIKDLEKDDAIIFDLSNNPVSITKTDAFVVVKQNQVEFVKRSGEIRIYPFSKDLKIQFTKDDYQNLLKKLERYGLIAAFIATLLIMYVYRLIQALIYGGIGILISMMLSVKLTYQQLIRLSIVAITPSAVLAAIFFITDYYFFGMKLLFFLITMGYLTFAIKVNGTVRGGRVNDH